MRDRRPGDWRTDLVGRHALEDEVGRALAEHPLLSLEQDRTDSVSSLDYLVRAPGDRRVEVELKAKLQRYVGWGAYRRDVDERDLFILDELALRHIVDAGRYAFLVVRDAPSDRWCVWNTGDLVLTSKVRVARRLATGRGRVKGKVLISMTEQSVVVPSLADAVAAIAADVLQIDRRWNDIAPWPAPRDAVT